VAAGVVNAAKESEAVGMRVLAGVAWAEMAGIMGCLLFW